MTNCKVCGEPAEIFCQCAIPTPPRPVSPYGVPAESVADVVPLSPDAPLAPFERDQLRRLLAQYHATPGRVKDAFLAEVAPPPQPNIIRIGRGR